MKKRTLSLILAALLAAQLTACGSSEQGGTDTTTAGNDDTTTAAETTVETSGVPAGTDFEGETVSIWYTTKASSVAETFVDLDPEQTGDILDDAIFEANVAVEEKLNVNLEFYNSQCPTSETETDIRTLLLADDTTYDLYHGVQWNAKNVIVEGLYMEVSDAPYISFDEPWWDSEYMDAMSIGEGKIFALVGDYAVDRTRCLSSLYFNKNMYTDFFGNANALYQDVLDKQWTMDRMHEISEQVYSDVNQDGKADRDDVLGFCVNDYNNIDAFFYGSGVPITQRDSKGYPEIIFNSERTINTAESVYRLVFETEGVFFSGPQYEEDVKNRTKFSEGTSMFLPGFFYTAEALRDMKDDYGIVPFPLADENQENYSSIIHDILRIMFVPYNCQKLDAVCAVLEEMAFEGYQNVLPAYYDVLMKNKYARDDISASMIDIIRDSVFADVGYTMSFGSVAKIPRLMIQGKNSDFASQYASIIDAANAKIEDYIEMFEDLK